MLTLGDPTSSVNFLIANSMASTFSIPSLLSMIFYVWISCQYENGGAASAKRIRLHSAKQTLIAITQMSSIL